MAFDDLSDEEQLEAIDWLSQAGVTRIPSLELVYLATR